MKKEKPQKSPPKEAEYKETLQRLQAEFENYKKRVEKEVKTQNTCANMGLVKELLPVIDSFELALKNQQNHEEFTKGIELIYAQLFSVLESEGLRPIKTDGEKFDPYKHEALMQEKSEKDGVILEELQKGYMLKDAVLRHSKVKVGKKEEKC
ncbi:MAG: nucleotide exchange factor GrpE [bacterium]|nr:nucleotide exchange factor GrpE [bacterium]